MRQLRCMPQPQIAVADEASVESFANADLPCWSWGLFADSGRRSSLQPMALASALAHAHQPPHACACCPRGALWPLHPHWASRDMSRARQPAAHQSLSCRRRTSEASQSKARGSGGGGCSSLRERGRWRGGRRGRKVPQKVTTAQISRESRRRGDGVLACLGMMTPPAVRLRSPKHRMQVPRRARAARGRSRLGSRRDCYC